MSCLVVRVQEFRCDQGPEVYVEIILLNLNLDFTIYVWAENVESK